MAPRPPSQPTERDASNHTRLLESLMEIIEITRNITRASTSSRSNQTEWSLESFLQHHLAKFNEKCLPDEMERAKELEKNVTEVEQHKKQQQQATGGPVSSRNNTNPRRTPYARPVLPSVSGGSQSQSLGTDGRSGQKKTVKCFKCGGPHYRSLCPQVARAKYCLRCGGSRHVGNECSMGGRAGLRPPNAGRGQPGRGGRAQAVGRVYALTDAEATSPATERLVGSDFSTFEARSNFSKDVSAAICGFGVEG
ncbi:hypothetical protein LR48_Vigan05g009100 [Vigna angularis]|uniref:CCHC-type domain-containing protein n=1 Tax=Phaseolus angularis TaxID=3914 RepID=A0A0L9UIX2_PHAAN|nr:hypothetical protein LR48_Vigan05g009100 [Vigna angularis]